MLQTAQIVPSIQRAVAPVLHVDIPLFAHICDNVVYRDFLRLREPANLEPGLHVMRKPLVSWSQNIEQPEPRQKHRD